MATESQDNPEIHGLLVNISALKESVELRQRQANSVDPSVRADFDKVTENERKNMARLEARLKVLQTPVKA